MYLEHNESEVSPAGNAIQKVAGVFAVLVFLADIALLVILLSTLLGGSLLRSSQPVPVLFLLVLVVFLFAIGLFVYAKAAYGDLFEGVVYVVFGWAYVLIGAGLAAVVARTFVLKPGFGLLDFLVYAVAVMFISTFGVIIAMVVREKVRYFSVPFMAVALWQVYLWVWRVLSRQGVARGWNLVGSLFLFIFIVLFIVFLIGRREVQGDDFPWQD